MSRLLTSLLLLAFSTSAWGDTHRYIVATHRPAREAASRLLGEGRSLERHDVRPFSLIEAFAADLTAEEVAELRMHREVRYVEPVMRRGIFARNATATANGSSYTTRQTTPYGIDLVRAREVWKVTKGESPRIHIAIVDTGVDASHPDLRPNYAGGFDTFTKSEQMVDDNRHGTHVAGTVAAADNGMGVVGVAPRVNMWAVKVLDRTGFGSTEQIIAGVDWVVAKKQSIGGNWIMSLSLGAPQASDAEREAFARATASGIISVAASGNGGFPALQFPAGYPDVLAVGAVDAQRKVTSFSNGGPMLDLVGPGLKVLSTLPVGSTLVGQVEAGEDAIHGGTLTGSPQGEVSAPYVFCGLGRPEEIPASVAGKIAVMRRGELTFNEKVRNATARGAVGAVIINRNDDTEDIARWTLILVDCARNGCNPRESDVQYPWPVTVAVSLSDGERLLARDPSTRIVIRSTMDDYGHLSGTSMATPHVSGAIALAWSLAPDATAVEVIHAVKFTAQDLGTPGFDNVYGHGLVDALAAAKHLAPSRFGTGAAPPPAPPRRRTSGS